MYLPLDRHSGLPVYRQIQAAVRLQVAGGVLAPGEELPSTRQLAAELGVNPMTVSKAYGLLEREGVVERRPGQSLVVRARAAAELEEDRLDQLRRALEPVVQLARQLDVSADEAVEVMRALARELDGRETPEESGSDD